jgi:CelD/BcsL family acetyltransferase involved in cellulose biosynthesis
MLERNANPSVASSEITVEVASQNEVVRRAPMQDAIWRQACVETLYPDHDIILLRDGSDTALGAFARQRRFPNRLFLMGSEEIGDPVDLLFRDRAGAEALAQSFKKLGLAGRFGHFPAASLFVTALHSAFSKGGFVATAPIEGSPFIALDEGWRDPMSQLSSRYRSDFRRMRKRADALGKVTTEILSPGPEAVHALLDEAVAVETLGWKGRAGTSLAKNERIATFFRRYTTLAAEQGILRIAFLRIDGTAVAMQIAVECHDRFWLFKIGYNEEYAHCSPGNLLMLETLKYATERGLAAYEFLGKAAPWTKAWTSTEHENIRLRVYPYTLRGLVALAIDGSLMAFTRMKRRGEEQLTRIRRKQNA